MDYYYTHANIYRIPPPAAFIWRTRPYIIMFHIPHVRLCARACVRNRSEDYYKNIVFVLRAFEAARGRTGRDETIIQQQNRGCSRAHESRPPTFITMVIFYRNGFYSYFVSRICLYRPRYTLPII